MMQELTNGCEVKNKRRLRNALKVLTKAVEKAEHVGPYSFQSFTEIVDTPTRFGSRESPTGEIRIIVEFSIVPENLGKWTAPPYEFVSGGKQ